MDGAIGRTLDVMSTPSRLNEPASDGGSSTTGCGIGDMFGTRSDDGGRFADADDFAGELVLRLATLECGRSLFSVRALAFSSSTVLFLALRFRDALCSAMAFCCPKEFRIPSRFCFERHGNASNLSPALKC